MTREPVGAAAAIPVWPVVGIMAAVLDHEELHRSGHALGQHLGVRRRYETVLPPRDDEKRALDLLSAAPQGELRCARLGFGLARGVAAHAEGLPGELGKRVPD